MFAFKLIKAIYTDNFNDYNYILFIFPVLIDKVQKHSFTSQFMEISQFDMQTK